MAALVLSSGAGAAGEQWKYFGTNQKGERFFYDASSVMYLSADLIQVWTRELTSEGPSKKLKEINCSHKIIRPFRSLTKNRGPFAPYLSDWRAMEQTRSGASQFVQIDIVQSLYNCRTIDFIFLKSLPTPGRLRRRQRRVNSLCQREVRSPLWQRGARGDFRADIYSIL
jgi:hypothetical protein